MRYKIVSLGLIYILTLSITTSAEEIKLYHDNKPFTFTKIKSYTPHTLKKPQYVSFEDSFDPESWDCLKSNEDVRELEKLYKKRNFKTISPSTGRTIPKIIHQVWVGGPFPLEFQENQQTYFKNHHGWLYKLWQEDDLERLGLQNKDLFDKAYSNSEKANIARYEILNIFGGVYVDTDTQSLMTLNPFHSYFNFYTAIEPFGYFRVGNAVIGSVPNHPLLKIIIKHIREHWDDFPPGKASQLNRTGTELWTSIVKENVPRMPQQTTVLPPSYFYPWQGYWNKNLKKEESIRPESYINHDWDVSKSVKEEKSNASEECSKINPNQLSSSEIVAMYQMLKDVHEIFTSKKLEYWAAGGTLLGAVRHHGFIPWDFDHDIFIRQDQEDMLVTLAPLFESLGYTLFKKRDYVYVLFKRSQADGKPETFKDQLHLDIILTYKDKDKIFYSCKFLQERYRREELPLYFLHEELYPLQLAQYGSFKICVPKDPDPYLCAAYGTDYLTHAWQHEENKKIPLREEDKGPALPLGPLKETTLHQER